ncbi:hypothetical protein N7523_006516 [Penicillium sp. IBT 18751x]|nr:hypothetical protein N7523_006516 [Penicillium sp. IBT 18751x]
MSSTKEAMTLQALLNEPKGKTEYYSGQAFLLHVFWEAPNQSAAKKVLSSLQRCANATHRDTPCVPIYFFRISTLDDDLVSPKPMTVGQHSQLRDAVKKLQFGVPRPAVDADLVRRRLDPKLLDADPATPLPKEMQEAPVILEFTELYLDERSFYEHAGSLDYLEAYGEMIAPGLLNKQSTVRLGNPTPEIVDKILAPMLNEQVEPLQEAHVLWRRPAVEPQAGMLLAFDILGDVDQVMRMVPDSLHQASMTLVTFAHPLCQGRVRVLSVLPALPDQQLLQDLACLPLEGIEAHCDLTYCDTIHNVMSSVSFKCKSVVKKVECGYLIHENARDVAEISVP